MCRCVLAACLPATATAIPAVAADGADPRSTRAGPGTGTNAAACSAAATVESAAAYAAAAVCPTAATAAAAAHSATAVLSAATGPFSGHRRRPRSSARCCCLQPGPWSRGHDSVPRCEHAHEVFREVRRCNILPRGLSQFISGRRPCSPYHVKTAY